MLFTTSFNIGVSYKKAVFNSLIYGKMSGYEERRFHLEISQSRAGAFHYVPSSKCTSQSTIICMHAMSCGQHIAPQTHSSSSQKTVARQVLFKRV